MLGTLGCSGDHDLLTPGDRPSQKVTPVPRNARACQARPPPSFFPPSLLSLLFARFLCPSHPSLSARFSHPGFLWHLSTVLICLAVWIFTFLKPGVFSCFFLLQPNKDFPLKSTHTGWGLGLSCPDSEEPPEAAYYLRTRSDPEGRGSRQVQAVPLTTDLFGLLLLRDRLENKQVVRSGPIDPF